MIDLSALVSVSVCPSTDSDKWLESAIDGIRYVHENARAKDAILYANVARAYIFSVLAPITQVTPLDVSDLAQAYLNPTAHWAIEHSSGGGEPDQMYLSSPVDRHRCKSTAGGEQLVFSRYFSGVDDGPSRIELSQRLVQALDLYWLDEHHAFCRLDDNGDIEPVITITRLEEQTGEPSNVVVTIKSADLHRYMAVTEMALVIKFDFTRFRAGHFTGWHGELERSDYQGDSLAYHAGTQSQCSFVNGALVVQPNTTTDALIRAANDDWDGVGRQYATFTAQDWKNKRTTEISCSPDALASYFEKDFDLPFQTTPAYFNAGVLQKYKADPEKYTLEHRSISSRAGWYLKTYDINSAGQVHAYLCDLANLPFNEQLYWKSFNEEPKAGISERAYMTDFEGSFANIPDAIVDLKKIIDSLDHDKPSWWQPRGETAAKVVHYPHTPSPEEWSNAILNLDQYVIEGFSTSALRGYITKAGGQFDRQWASIRLLQQCYISSGLTEPDAATVIAPLRRLHYLRSKLKGHLAESEKQTLIKEARKEHGSLPLHFQKLADDVYAAFQRTAALLS